MTENSFLKSEIKGCYALYGSPCHNCGGGWPGTKSSGNALTSAAVAGRLNPERMGCGPLVEQVKVFMLANNIPYTDSPEITRVIEEIVEVVMDQ